MGTRTERLRDHPDLPHPQPELLQMAAQMSVETRSLALWLGQAQHLPGHFGAKALLVQTANVSWIARLRAIKSTSRTAAADIALATMLAAIAGAANAGGFVLLGNYTSHMTGYLSQLADNIALQNMVLVVNSTLAIGLFIAGAATASFTINWARQHRPAQQYSLPIGVQGVLFLGLVVVGAAGLSPNVTTYAGLGLLSFIMGFQNATITKISYARIRTTHATGMVTDVGIELGRAAYGRTFDRTVKADRAKLLLLLRLLLVFLIGGIIGALGYGTFEHLFSLPLAAILLVLSVI